MSQGECGAELPADAEGAAAGRTLSEQTLLRHTASAGGAPAGSSGRGRAPPAPTPLSPPAPTPAAPQPAPEPPPEPPARSPVAASADGSPRSPGGRRRLWPRRRGSPRRVYPEGGPVMELREEYLAAAFKRIDASGRGVVSREEIVTALRSDHSLRQFLCVAGMPAAALKQVFLGLETDSTAEVGPQEFTAELALRRRVHQGRRGGSLRRHVTPAGETVWTDVRGRVVMRAVLHPDPPQSVPEQVDVATDAMPPQQRPHLLMLCLWYLVHTFTSILYYAVWLRHREDELGRGVVYAYAAFLLLGSMVLFGVVAPLLFITLTAREVRKKRDAAIALLWVAQDLAFFILEYDVMLRVGVDDVFQGLSLLCSSFAGVVPPWWVYVRAASDMLHAIYADEFERPESGSPDRGLDHSWPWLPPHPGAHPGANPAASPAPHPPAPPPDVGAAGEKWVYLRGPEGVEGAEVAVRRWAPLSEAEDEVRRSLGWKSVRFYRPRTKQRVRLRWPCVQDGEELNLSGSSVADADEEETREADETQAGPAPQLARHGSGGSIGSAASDDDPHTTAPAPANDTFYSIAHAR
eukprot:TRINITY_DN11190_c0_g1_i1.p1 TRINITY_DN11190_c0_g1~~TRINITY_DN11190_c0_g1_i1.p1  ORF type:complete len:604 (+),score=141.27 TRINITY_DN11190_c0_g1_i1:80-1813(+)